MGQGLPPQRRQGGATGGGPGASRSRAITNPKEGAEEAERRLGRPCFYAGQKVPGMFRCTACQFGIRNRGTLPACPECGELVWAYMDEGPRPIPEGETADLAAPTAQEPAGPLVQENVKLDAPVTVQENVKLEP